MMITKIKAFFKNLFKRKNRFPKVRNMKPKLLANDLIEVAPMSTSQSNVDFLYQTDVDQITSIANIIPYNEEINVTQEYYDTIYEQFKNEFNFELQIDDTLYKRQEGDFLQLAGAEFIDIKRNGEVIKSFLTKMN